MTYVTGNLHGCYTKFMELLRQIKFRDRDVMYILGDIVDIGDEPMELVCDLSMRYNVYTVAGEHDFKAVRMLAGFEKMLSSGSTPDAKYISEMQAWMAEGGKSTLEGYRGLDGEMKEGVIDYLSDLGLYEEIEVAGKQYVLVHAGIGDLTEGGEGDCAPEVFFDTPVDFTAISPMPGKTVIAAHIPTSDIPGATAGSIYYGDGIIAVDCGAGRGGRIGCIRLEDGAEFYA